MAQQVLINGQEFSAADITVLMNGINIASIISLSITKTQNKQNNYGFGKEPVSRGRGIIEYECSVEMAYKDVLKLRNTVASRELLDIAPFDILVIMNNGQNISRYKALNCEFSDDGLEVGSDDPQVTREYTLIIAGTESF